MCILSPTIGGLKEMLNVCEKYGEEFDVMFNPKKTQCMKFAMDNSGMNFDCDITLCGQKLEWVSTAKYLGNWITHNLKENVEIDKKMCAFFGNVNSLRACFTNVGYKNISILYNRYCCHYYGSQAWRLSDKSVPKIFIAWNKSVRYLCALPYDTHTYYLPYIVDTLSVKDQIYMRSANMIVSMLGSCNESIKFLANGNLHNHVSVIGENWHLIKKHLEIEEYGRCVKQSLLRKKNEMMTPECSVLLDMLDVLNNDAMLHGFSRNEVECILFDMCRF